MRNSDPRKVNARRIVAERLRRFVGALKAQLDESTEEFWQRVESKLDHRAGPEDHGHATR